MAAPANPPISVCEDEDGIPFHHVIRFQVMAAMTPANIIGKVIYCSTTVLDTVLANTESAYYVFGNEKSNEIEESSP